MSTKTLGCWLIRRLLNILAQNTGIFPNTIFYMKGKFVLKRERYKIYDVTPCSQSFLPQMVELWRCRQNKLLLSRLQKSGMNIDKLNCHSSWLTAFFSEVLMKIIYYMWFWATSTFFCIFSDNINTCIFIYTYIYMYNNIGVLKRKYITLVIVSQM